MTQHAETAIANLIYRYAEHVDAGDFGGVAQLFAEGAVMGPDGKESRGYEAVRKLYEDAVLIYPETGTPCTQHVTTNLVIELDDSGERATTRSVFSVLQAVEGFPLQVIIAGRYEDELVRQGGTWRFHRRQIFPTLAGDLSHHLRVQLETAPDGQ